jgi:hypothetical protein
VDKLPDQRVIITKLAAGRSQLKTAIQLWFGDGELPAIHTLAAAAYEILHNLSLAGEEEKIFCLTRIGFKIALETNGSIN